MCVCVCIKFVSCVCVLVFYVLIICGLQSVCVVAYENGKTPGRLADAPQKLMGILLNSNSNSDKPVYVCCSFLSQILTSTVICNCEQRDSSLTCVILFLISVVY